ncbi:MAG: carbon-nitrogen hydrolase [Tannerellaceae bacterium]|jgi:N-carbamoylputrescine amidase|nr:carbon-nitrogen hydrolase [Tannerellaceae bacterium]
MKVGIVQQAFSGKQAENISQLVEAIRNCAAEGAVLVVLPELHNTLYFCQREDVSCFDFAETIPGPSTELFGKLARELGVILVLSLFEKRTAGLYHNTAVVLEADGSIVGYYRKMHIPDDPGYYEKFYFTPGDCGFEPIATSVGRLGILVCWDQWFPEAARLMALKGAEMLVYPTAIGWEISDGTDEQARQLDAWLTIQRAHAIANGLPLVAVNRCGYEPDLSTHTGGIRFWGNSFATGVQGEILFRMGEEIDSCVVDIDLTRTEQIRRWWPFFRDRRTDAYSELTQRYLKDG